MAKKQKTQKVLADASNMSGVWGQLSPELAHIDNIYTKNGVLNVTSLFETGEVSRTDILATSPSVEHAISTVADMNLDDDVSKYMDFLNTHFTKIKDKFACVDGTFRADYVKLSFIDITNGENSIVGVLLKTHDPAVRYDRVFEHTLSTIDDLRTLYYAIAESQTIRKIIEADIKTALLNIRNFRLAMLNCDVNDTIVRALSVDIDPFVWTTLVQSNRRSAKIIAENLDVNITSVQTLGEVIFMILDPIANWRYERMNIRLSKIDDPAEYKEFKKNIKSKAMFVAFSTYNGLRPSEDYGDYEFWNGFQTFDLDIKNDPSVVNITEAKERLHSFLQKYSWYVGIKHSLSGTGLHIITKVIPNNYDGTDKGYEARKRWFAISYYAKFCAIKYLLTEELNFDKSKEVIFKVIDKSMAKVAQGIIINYDPDFMLNSRWLDLPIGYEYTKPPVEGIELNQWLYLPENLGHMFSEKKKIAVDDTELKDRVIIHDILRDTNAVIANVKSATMPTKFGVVRQFPSNMYAKGAKDSMRACVCRTMVYIYGSECEDILRHILDVPGEFSEQEFVGKYRYACSHPKYFDVAAALLKKLGMKFEVEEDASIMEAVAEIEKAVIDIPTRTPDALLHLEDNMYLSSIENLLFEKIDDNKINLIESAPGTGKTYLFNNLAIRKRILLVEPYVSVMQNKIEKDERIAEYFDICYGTKQIDLTTSRSIATTFDKFSRIPKSEYKNFDIIVIDESHLLFTSKYRDKVTTAAVKNARTFVNDELRLKNSINFDISDDMFGGSFMNMYDEIKNSTTKVIMMTGTVTGELLYFGSMDILNYIKVTKRSTYEKKAHIILYTDKVQANVSMVDNAAKAILDGRTLIIPSNDGDVAVDTIVATINIKIAEVDPSKCLDETEVVYYKKSNTEHEYCALINDQSMLHDKVRIVFCTVYLGVGVDILNSDRKFSVMYMGGKHTAQDIEQFNNRIRKADIECFIYLDGLLTRTKATEDMLKAEIPELVDVAQHKETILDDYKAALVASNFNAQNEKRYRNIPKYLSEESIFHDSSYGEVNFNVDRFIIRHYADDYARACSGGAYIKFLLENSYGYQVFIDAPEFKNEDDIEVFSEKSKAIRLWDKMEKTRAMLQVTQEVVNNPYHFESNKNVEFVPYYSRGFELDVEYHESVTDVENSTSIRCSILYAQRYTNVVREAIKNARFLTTLYTSETIIKLIETIHSFTLDNDDSPFNFDEYNNTVEMVNIAKLSTESDLPIPTLDTMKIVDLFLGELQNDHDSGMNMICIAISDVVNPVSLETERRYVSNAMGLEMLKMGILKYADKFYSSLSEGTVFTSKQRRENVYNNIDRFLKVFVRFRKRGDSVTFQRRTIPNFDSNNITAEMVFENIVKQYLYANISSKSKDMVSEGDHNSRSSDEFLMNGNYYEYC